MTESTDLCLVCKGVIDDDDHDNRCCCFDYDAVDSFLSDSEGILE